jgi:phage gp29-like protein
MTPRRQPTPEASAARVNRLVVASNAYRDQQNPLRGLTMPTAVNWLENAQRGIFSDLMWAYEVGIEPGNADLLCIRERSEAAVRDCEWTVKQIDPDTSRFDQRLADDQEAFLRSLWEGVENLSDAIAFLDSFRFRGFAHVSPWPADSDPLLIKQLQPLDQWNLARDGYRGPWHWNPKALQVPASSLPPDSKLDPSEYCVLSTSRAVNRIALVGHVRASIAEKDWDAYVEIFGIPGVFVIMPENVPEGKVSEFLEMAEAAAEQASGALPNGSQVVTSQEARSSQPFQPRLEWIQKQVILAGTGGLLTMLAESGSGTLAGSVHADAFRQIGRGVARRISEAFQRQIEKPRLEKLFPGRPVLAYFDMQPPEYRDQTQVVANIVALAQQGYSLDAAQVSELTGYDVPEKSNDSAQQLLKNLYPLIAAGYRPNEKTLEKLLGIPLDLVPVASPQAFARMRATASEERAAESQSALLDIQETFARLERMARDPAVSDADLQAAIKDAAAAMPELLPDLTAAIARPMALDMAAAAVQGAADGQEPGAAPAPASPQEPRP